MAKRSTNGTGKPNGARKQKKVDGAVVSPLASSVRSAAAAPPSGGGADRNRGRRTDGRAGGGDDRGGGGGRRAMSETKLAEEAALTALLFGGGGGAPIAASAAAWADEDEDDRALLLRAAAGDDDNEGDGDDDDDVGALEGADLFAIDRSGEDIPDNHDDAVVDGGDDDGGSDDDDDDDEEENYGEDSQSEEEEEEAGATDGREGRVAMTGAAWRDVESEGGDSDDDGDVDSDEDGDDDDVDDDDDDDGDERQRDEEGKRRRKTSGGVSLVDGPNRLKKLRRHIDEEDPISFGEYELRLRERFVNTASVASRTDWADVGLARKKEERRRGRMAEGEAGDARDRSGKKRKGGGGYASPTDDESSDDDYGGGDAAARIFGSNAPLFESSSGDGRYRASLPPTLLDVVRVRDGNLPDPNGSVVSACQFHPASDELRPLLMTAGMDKMLRFFRVNDDGGGGGDGGDGEGTTTKIHGIQFPDMPVTCASFVAGGSSVVLSGRRPFFYVYDATSGGVRKIPGIVGRAERSLEKFRVSPDGRVLAFVGNDGYVILVDASSGRWICDLKMNGSARAIAFSDDGEYVLGSGSDGDVYR